MQRSNQLSYESVLPNCTKKPPSAVVICSILERNLRFLVFLPTYEKTVTESKTVRDLRSFNSAYGGIALHIGRVPMATAKQKRTGNRPRGS